MCVVDSARIRLSTNQIYCPKYSTSPLPRYFDPIPAFSHSRRSKTIRALSQRRVTLLLGLRNTAYQTPPLSITAPPMSSTEGPATAGGLTDEPTVTSKEANAIVFDVSPAIEAAIPAPKQGESTMLSPAILGLIAAFMRHFVLQSIAEEALPDWKALGPDSFSTLQEWRLRGHAVPGQPSNDIKIIDVEGNGTTIDRGEAAFDQAGSILQIPLPQGNGACRVIIRVPELGRMDKEFARRAVNLAGEKIRGVNVDESVFEKTHFRTRISPGFDFARLRDLWIMDDVAWKPFSLPILSMRAPTDRPGLIRSPTEGCVRAMGRDVMYIQHSWILVQTIPLQGDRFLFLCALPSRKFRETTPLQSATDLADIKELTKDTPSPSKEEIFRILSRDQERSCMECFVSLLLSDNSATRLADGRTDRLCQLLLLDVFRAVSETSTRLNRDMKATMYSLDLPQFNNENPDKVLMELKNNCVITETHLSYLALAKLGAEHLLQWLSLDDASEPEPGGAVSANDRWLKRVTLALQADLDHSRSEIETSRDYWTRWWTSQGEHIKRLESKNVAKLTLLAAVFLPLSFGADLLGMQFRLSELGLILYDYLGLVVSAGLFLFVIHKVLPVVQSVFRAFESDSPAKKRPALRLTKFFLKSNWLPVLIALWSILVASFMIGMTGGIPRSLVVLKYGTIAWSALFLAYVLFATAWGWGASKLWGFLGWNIIS